MTSWESKDIRPLVEKGLAAATATDAVISVEGNRQGATRFANSEINQNVARSDRVLTAQVAFDGSVGRSSTNDLSDRGIDACVARAEEIAHLSPADPEHMPPVEPVELPEVQAWSVGTAEATPADRAGVVASAVKVAERAKASGAGSFTTTGRIRGVGNSAGHYAFHRSSDASLPFSATAEDAVGWAEALTTDWRDIEVDALAGRAVGKALDGRSPAEIEPGKYNVILEPAAVGSLIAMLLWVQADAKSTDEGRTFLTGKLGTKIAADGIHVYSDPLDKALPARPFDDEGMKLGRVDWIKGGVLENLSYSRYWASKQGKLFTGRPSNFIIGGGGATTEEMIASTERGLLISRFWYIRTVDRMRDLFTGMTRDGTFLVEKGKIKGPVKNLRFNDSAIGLLSRVEALGKQEPTDIWGMQSRAPYLKATQFNFTGTTDF